MSTKLKLYLGRKIIDSVSKYTKLTPVELLPIINIGNQYPNNNIELNIPAGFLEKHWGITDITQILKIQPDDIIKRISLNDDRTNRSLNFEVDRSIFVKDVLENGSKSDLNLKPKRIVIDFSSPNVAKPFHFGHLRSTIIGNFISNLNLFLSNKVVKLNYLGDWGTQFGFIKVGVDELKYTPEDIRKNPMKLLYESYVYANKLAENDTEILNRAKLEFNKLEHNSLDTSFWKEYVGFTRDELDRIYKRLGVKFDEYNYESMYNAHHIANIIEKLKKKNIVQQDNDGVLSTIVNKTQRVVIVKSDGSTLYLTRDIAAAIDRFERFQFDKMYYVVDNSQSEHFNALKQILHRMDQRWSERLHHIKFGKVRGMSSRKGKAVFLQDILDECRELMHKKQIESPTTKVAIDNGEITDVLGVSCVIVNDLKQRRQKDYDFNWDKVLQVNGDTGIKLQYTHCRLHSLEKNSGAMLPKTCDPSLIVEPEITAIIKEIAKFHEVLYRSNEQLEACILVKYLFQLCNHISKGLSMIQIKGQDPAISSQRLLVFHVAKEVLGEGMKILGLQPLDEM